MVEALDRVVDGLRAEELDDEVRLHQLGAHERTLDVIDVLVVLQSARGQARLLAQHADASLVVVREHLVGHDGVGHLRHRHQVHLEQARLERPLLGLVALEHVEQERGGLLQAVVRHEDIGDHAIVERDATGSGLLRKLERAARIHAHHVREQEAPIGRVVHLLAVDHDLVELSRRHKHLDDLGRALAAQVDGEGEVLVDHRDGVAELLGALKLVLTDPLLEQLLLALLDDGLSELERLHRVELALLEQHAEVGEDGRRATWRRGRGLEARDRVGRAQNLLRRVGRQLGCILVVALLHQSGELLDEELLSPRQVAARGDAERELEVGELLADVGHKVGLIDGHAEHLALAVHAHDAAGRVVRRRHEDRLARDSVHVDELARLEVVQVQVAELGDHVHDVVLVRDLHRDREVLRRLRREVDVAVLLAEGRCALGTGARTHLDDVQLGAGRRLGGESE